MHFALWQYLIMLPIGILGGIVSSSVGMASLVTYPALLYLGGIPPVTANVTNTSSMIFSGFGSIFSSLPELKGHVKETINALILTLIGGIGGVYALLAAPKKDFEFAVPWFILVSALLILWPKSKKAGQKKLIHSKKGMVIALTITFLIYGAYSSYFSAGAGVLALGILAFISTEPFPVYNAIRNVAALSANVISIVIFTLKTTVYWSIALPLGIGMMIGGYIGPVIVRYVPEKVMKLTVGILALGLSAYFFYTT